MKRGEVIASVLFSVFFISSTVPSVLAQGRMPPLMGEGSREKVEREDPHRRFREGTPDRKRRHSPFSERGMKEALHLDDGQAKKMRNLIREYRKGVILKKANLRIAMIELEEAVSDRRLVIAEIEKKAKEKAAAATALVMVRVRALSKAKGFLSEEQFNKFMDLIAHRMRGRHRGMSGRHGRFGKKFRHERGERRGFGERRFG
ncbi:MAG: hypothetical protein ACE5HN_11045, partial [Nitrospiria bacterium]